MYGKWTALRLSIAAACFFGVMDAPSSAGAAKSLWKPPEISGLRGLMEAVHPTVAHMMVSTFRVADSRVVFERTNLLNLVGKLNVRTGADGDASESLRWLCLTGTNAGHSWILWLTSGEIDGGTVGGLRVQVLEADEQPDSRCKAIIGDAPPVDLGIPLRLGMTRSEVIRVLGKPSASAGTLTVYYHEHKKPIYNSQTGLQDDFLVMNSVSIAFNGDVVEGIDVLKSTQD